MLETLLYPSARNVSRMLAFPGAGVCPSRVFQQPRDDFAHSSSWLAYRSQRKQAQKEVRSYPTSCCHCTIYHYHYSHYSIQCCFWCIWTLLYGYYINAKSISIALFDDTFHPMVPRKLHIQVGHGLFFTVFSHFPNFLSLGWSKDIDMILGKLV